MFSTSFKLPRHAPIARTILLPHRRHMSVRPPKSPPPSASSPQAKKTTIARLAELRASKTPISVLTAYDFPTARACSAHPVDITLVGDSLAQVCLGYPSTTRLTLDEMLHHCRAVARGTTTPLLVADMPFGTYAPSPRDAVQAAVRMIQEGQVEAVKLEGGEELVPHIRALTTMGIPVMAHIGLLPQRSTSLSGYRVQGRSAEAASSLLRAALALEKAGAFSIVLEAVPSQLGEYITEQLEIPTIGIGAGPGTSGQVLVWDDMLGTWHGHKAKFVRHFANVREEVAQGVAAYVDAVKDGSFPHPVREGYSMDPQEWEAFLRSEGREVPVHSSPEGSTTQPSSEPSISEDRPTTARHSDIESSPGTTSQPSDPRMTSTIIHSTPHTNVDLEDMSGKNVKAEVHTF